MSTDKDGRRPAGHPRRAAAADGIRQAEGDYDADAAGMTSARQSHSSDTSHDTTRAVTVTRTGGVGTLTLNRPERNNAWSREVAVALGEAIDAVRSDTQIRVVVITGSGRSFCVGADARRLTALAGGGSLVAPPSPWDEPQILALRKLDKPVIAAINGGCAAIGLLIALCADVRFCADSARLSTSYARRGLPAEYGLSWLLSRIVGASNAADLLLSGRIVDAEEAQRLGLVNWVVPHEGMMEVAEAYAADIAENCSPSALRMIKRQIAHDLENTFDSSRLLASFLLDSANKSHDFQEGSRSLSEKRKPRFAELED
jgi:enoyl-CoA hydratase/carnithine racemase